MSENWQVGDRAYCLRGTMETMPTLEKGKVYVVAEVIPLSWCTGCGLRMSGVAMPGDVRGFWSNRFSRMTPRNIDSIEQGRA